MKRILYWARRIDDAQVPNQLPLIESVSTYPERDVDTFDPLGTVEPIEPVAPLRGHRRARSRSGSSRRARTAETFETTVIDPETHQAVPFTVPRETLRYRFFATAGIVRRRRSRQSEPDPGFVAKGPIHIESECTPAGRGPR